MCDTLLTSQPDPKAAPAAASPAPPSPAPLDRVAHWDEEYETRKLKELRWVRLPNHPDDLSYRRLVAHPRAGELLAAWLVIIQVASRGSRTERGCLLRHGEPLTAQDLGLISGLPAAVFELALPLLASKAIGWLVAEPFTPALPVSPAAPAVSVPVPSGGPTASGGNSSVPGGPPSVS